MTRLLRTAVTCGLFLQVLTFSACAGGQDQSAPTETPRGEAAQALQENLKNDPALEAMLAKSITLAAALNPDTMSNPVQSVDQFLAYTERAETSMPWDLIQGDPSKPSDNIFAAFAAFYFVLDQPLPELEGKGLYRPALQYYPPFSKWLTTFNNSWRRFLDSEASWDAEDTKLVQGDPAFGLQNGWYEDPSNWNTFNEFFARYLSSPAARPIASPNDDAVVVSYADAVPLGTWAIDSASDVLDPAGVDQVDDHPKCREPDRRRQRVQGCLCQRDAHPLVPQRERLPPLSFPRERNDPGGPHHPGHQPYRW
jgi:phosphatidylserine decarboxylase